MTLTGRFLVAIAAAAFSAATQAGSFTVTPVRIYMLPKDRAVAITLTNEADSEVVLQAELNTWTQKPDGTDELTPTEDLILSPPIIKLAPRARQVVRLAMIAPRDATRQMTYRLVVREVPEVLAKPDAIQIPVSLVLSMPVFITPPKAQREVQCDLAGADKTLQVRCANHGTAYAQVREATVKRGERELARFEGGAYILPGAAKTLSLQAAGAEREPGPAELAVTFDDGKRQIFGARLP